MMAANGKSVKMVAVLFISEAGLALIDEENRPIYSIKFKSENLSKFLNLMSSINIPELDDLLNYAQNNNIGEMINPWVEIQPLIKERYNACSLEQSKRNALEENKLSLMTSLGLVSDDAEAMSIIRDFAIYKSDQHIKEEASRPDLQCIQGVQALDEIDKTFNLLYMRIREWYGLHFPELDQFIEDPKSYVAFVNAFKDKKNIGEEGLKDYGFSKQKTLALIEASSKSRGTELREQDLQLIWELSNLAISSYKIRDKLSKYIEINMRSIAPNTSMLLGSVIGARIMAKAGSLERLAKLPASTIQILGAEKALFRAIKSGGRPPKHGLIFQHELIHDAPKWQRGKMARALASKVALGARLDFFGGRLDERLSVSLNRKVEEIRKKYDKPEVKETRDRYRGRRRR